jgi:geranylgeranyl diphosphate synthase type II
MLGGQMLDLLSEGKTIDFNTLEQIHRGKTASLISAALEFGGILAKASAADIIALQKAGEAIGIAFQFTDDILDTTSSREELGKPIGSDHNHSKATAVSLLGIENAQKSANALLQTAQEIITDLSCNPSLLTALFDQMIHRRK